MGDTNHNTSVVYFSLSTFLDNLISRQWGNTPDEAHLS